MKKRLGSIETQFFAYLQMRKIRLVEAGKTLQFLGLTKLQEVELFRRLTRGRIIARVRPGLYLVPERLPLGGIWTPNEIEALNALIQDQKGIYQICGPNAWNRYGYSEQIPNRTYAYNNRISGDRMIGSIQLTLIKVSDKRFGGTVVVKTFTGETAQYPTRERTLLDAVYDWARFNTLPRAFEWIRSDLKKKLVDPKQLVDMVLKYGDVGTRRRFGYLLEQEKCDERLLKKIERTLAPTSSYIPLVPGRTKKGKASDRWGIINNEEKRTH
jgi:predicted transcriptional regulator of viral defense system